MAKHSDRPRRGPVGPRGKQGARGRRGATVHRADILAIVDDQFTAIRQELSLQLTRIAQIQSQLDHIHATLKKAVGDELSETERNLPPID